ncbi:F-box/LRR-repeat protein 16 [Tupaia chinensis]|uniref:F-box/LRR-repeat protein 16 n=1 Tax=Tupaia chinensis TaxID=246437 RepID=UPI0007046C6A|nr:F-box/LRR-repeat protein 16 [Tupaia chinensis]
MRRPLFIDPAPLREAAGRHQPSEPPREPEAPTATADATPWEQVLYKHVESGVSAPVRHPQEPPSLPMPECVRKMSSPGIDGDPKPPCLPRNGLLKLPGRPSSLGAASITKGTPAAKNRACQPPPPPGPAAPPPRAGPAAGPCPPAGGPTSAPTCGSPAERPPLATDEKILNGLFWYFSACEKCVLAQVCKAWRRVLYQPKFWAGLTPVLHAKELYNVLPGGEKEFVSLQGFAARGFEGFCLVGVSDLDICEFIDNYALSKKGVKAMSLKRSTITDAGLEVMLEQMQGVVRLELSGCNDFTEAGLWSSLSARITSLSVSDCINVADDAIAAISQLLPNLAELSLQAYHVTDTALAYFTARQGHSTHTLRLLSCWEITNHGVVNVVHSLPNLTALSLSGCSKVTDDGVELVAENLRKLRSLDLSWCPRITDMALEYVACDLHRLEELVLDRCVRITDTGLSYLSAMSSLRSLYLRWSCQVGLPASGRWDPAGCGEAPGHRLRTCPPAPPMSVGFSGSHHIQPPPRAELSGCPGSSEAHQLPPGSVRGQETRWNPASCPSSSSRPRAEPRGRPPHPRPPHARAESYLVPHPCQVQDFGLKHLLAMRSLRLLSLAGCPLLTTTGLAGLVQLHELEELELTNCPGATPELFKYFSQHLPRHRGPEEPQGLPISHYPAPGTLRGVCGEIGHPRPESRPLSAPVLPDLCQPDQRPPLVPAACRRGAAPVLVLSLPGLQVFGTLCYGPAQGRDRRLVDEQLEPHLGCQAFRSSWAARTSALQPPGTSLLRRECKGVPARGQEQHPPNSGSYLPMASAPRCPRREGSSGSPSPSLASHTSACSEEL